MKISSTFRINLEVIMAEKNYGKLSIGLDPAMLEEVKQRAAQEGITPTEYARRAIELSVGFDPWAWSTFKRFSENFDISLALALETWGLAALATNDAEMEVTGAEVRALNGLLQMFVSERDEKTGSTHPVRGERFYHVVMQREIERLVRERVYALLKRSPALDLTPAEIKFLDVFASLISEDDRDRILMRCGPAALAASAAKRIEQRLAEEARRIEEDDRLVAEAREKLGEVPENIDDATLVKFWRLHKEGHLSLEGLRDQLRGMSRVNYFGRGGGGGDDGETSD